jgi:RimJ/RimL family protein N-acetyltransferase
MVRPFADILTTNLRIRMATPADAAFITQLENDEDRKRLVGGVSGKSVEFYRKSLAAIRDLRCLIVESVDSGGPIGRCGLLTDSISDDCAIHIVLARDSCGRGVGTEIALELRRLASDAFPDKTLTAKVHPENAPSLAIISKLGLTTDGTISSESYDNGWLKYRARSLASEPSN